MRTILVVAPVLFSTLFSNLTEIPQIGDQDRTNFEAALEIELENLRPLQLPGAEVLARIAEASDGGMNHLLAASLFAAADGGDALRIARVPVGGTEDGSFAVIVLTQAMDFVRAAVVDGAGKVVAEWSHFMEDLQWYDVPRLEGAQPRSHLARLRAEAEANGDDEDALLTAGLLRLLEHMNQQASIFNLPRQSQTLSFAEGARMMSREYGKVAELAPALKPILRESADEFVRLARDSSAAAAALAVAADEGNATSGRAAQGRVMQNCSTCHDLALTELDGPLKKATAEARGKRGVGDGFYQIGHDMRIRHADRERAQLVADALRRGALLLDSLSSGE
jgi:hypothetical protein